MALRPGQIVEAGTVLVRLDVSVEEAELVLRWMEKPGTRLVEVTGTLACRTPGTGALRGFLDLVDAGRSARDPFGDDRAGATRARPERLGGAPTRRRSGLASRV